jgi:hypothetical protein
MIPVFERAKMVPALDHVATVLEQAVEFIIRSPCINNVVFKDVMLCFEEHISFVFRDDMEVIL